MTSSPSAAATAALLTNLSSTEEVGRKRKRDKSDEQDEPVAKMARRTLENGQTPADFSRLRTLAAVVTYERDAPEHTLAIGAVNSFMPSRGKRKVTATTSNLTSSVGNFVHLPRFEQYGLPLVLNTEDDPRRTTPQGIELAERIRHHARKRISMVYQLFVVYWKSGLTIERSNTIKQHGVGPFGGTAAAHSSILPGVKDDFYPKISQTIREEGISRWTSLLLEAVGVPDSVLEALKDRLDHDPNFQETFSIHDHFEEAKQEQFISRRSHFYQSMNSTVVLPKEVNQYDICLENVMRNETVSLLNQLAKDELHPYDALETYCKKSEAFFAKSRENLEAKIALLDKLNGAEQALFTAEIEIKNCDLSNPAECYAALETFSRVAYDFKKTLKEIDAVDHTLSVDYKLNKRMSKIKPMFGVVGGPLRRQQKGFDRFFTEELLKDPSKAQGLVRELQKLSNDSMKVPYNISWVQDPLARCIATCDLQAEASALPDYIDLSYKFENGVRRPLSEEELFMEKLNIIRALPAFSYADADFPLESVYPRKPG